MRTEVDQLDFTDETGWRHDRRGLPDRPERPPLGAELIDEMQHHLQHCYKIGTISLIGAVKLYRDWMLEDVDNPNYPDRIVNRHT